MPGFTSVTFQQGGMRPPRSAGGDFGGGKLSGIKKGISKLFKKGKGKKKDLGDAAKPKKSAMDRIKSAREGMKNKSFSEIKKNAPDSKTAKKQIAKEVGKRVLKKAAKSAVGAGAAMTLHVATGGEPFSSKDMKDMTTDATIGIVKKTLNGDLSEKAIEGEMVNSLNRVMQRRGGKPVKDFSKTMERIVALKRRLDNAHNIRHRELHGNRNVLAIGPKAFGSGKMVKNKRGKRSAINKKNKKGKKNQKKSKKFNVMKNVCRHAHRSERIRDVFDV